MKWVKTNWLSRIIFPNYVWNIPNLENKVYLTFDDGPTPEITSWVLDQLSLHKAKATFFCIGDNISKNPELFQLVLEQGHSVGNHTNNHLNGWKTSSNSYLENVLSCEKEISSLQDQITKIFRPPYGKITPFQSRRILKLGYKIIMWHIVSYDFDASVSKDKCLKFVLTNIKPGSIVVFHDSKKAFNNLEYVLPKVLEFCTQKGFDCKALV